MDSISGDGFFSQCYQADSPRPERWGFCGDAPWKYRLEWEAAQERYVREYFFGGYELPHLTVVLLKSADETTARQRFEESTDLTTYLNESATSLVVEGISVSLANCEYPDCGSPLPPDRAAADWHILSGPYHLILSGRDAFKRGEVLRKLIATYAVSL